MALPKNTLLKDLKTITVVGQEQSPATPYRPAVPARIVWTTQTICQWQTPRSPGPGQGPGYWVPGPSVAFGNGQVGNRGTWVSTAPPTSEQKIWVCSTNSYPTYIPAQPAIPSKPDTTVKTSRTETSYNLGWNAGARSAGVFTGNATVAFNVRRSVVGVICGMRLDGSVLDGYSGKTIDHAFYLARGQARVMQKGVMGVYVGVYDDVTRFKIERSGSSVLYYMGLSMVHSEPAACTNSGWLEAALYSAADEVFDPVIAQVSPPDLTEQSGEINAFFQPLELTAADRDYAAITVTFRPLSVAAESGALAPSFSVLDIVFAPLSSTLQSETGEIGQVEAVFPPMQVLAADHPYGEMFVSMAPLAGDVSALEGNGNAMLHSSATLDIAMSPVSLLFVTMSSAGTISSAWVEDVLIPASLMSSASMASVFATNALMDAVLASVATSGAVLGVSTSGAGGTDDGSQTWVVNLDSTGSTTYTNYGFNSFAHIDGRDYGANEMGIFALEGDTDVGMPIRARLSLGKLDFDSSQRKVISEAFVGISALGNVFIKVIANGEAYVYQTQRFDANLQQQRVKFGRGLNANYLELEIYNEEGADFEIDTVEFLVADLNRKT